VNTRYVASLIAIAAFLIRFLLLGAIDNDHYVYLARAHQVLRGEWPVRDFVDPGMPLAYLVSAAAAAVAGPTLLTEAVLSVALFAVGIAVMYALVRRASGSTLLALLAVAFVLLLPPRLYNSSKMLVPLVAIAVAWLYADAPSMGRAAALGAWIGIAFLVRHDYAAYVGIAAAPFLVVRHWGEWKRLAAGLAMCSGIALATVAPWLIYVEVQQGLPEYFASAGRFSMAERNRTVSHWPLVFYATAAVPLVALALGARGTRYLKGAHVVFATLVVFASELVLLRDEPAARLPDVVGTTAVLGAVIAGRFMPLTRATRTDSTPPIILTSALITAAGVALFTARESIQSAIPNVVDRWQNVSMRLHEGRPEIMPNPGQALLVRLIEQCVGTDERVLIGGFGPELPVLAHRGFAGGLPDWIRGYYENPSDVARARAQLARERVALAVMLDGGDGFTQSWPAVAGDLKARGLTEYTIELPSGPVEVWLRPATPLDGQTKLPCARR
jgi:hypothetical protein